MKYVVARLNDHAINANRCLGWHGKEDRADSLGPNVDVFDTVEDAKAAGFEYYGTGHVFDWVVCEYEPEHRRIIGRCHYVHSNRNY